MLVDTHAYKEAFVDGRAMGFVIADESSPKTNFGTRPGFAEVFDLRESYCIFEDRAMAEERIAKAVARNPSLTSLVIREVNVDSIRAYQLLAGRKTVFLVDRQGQTTQSLRVGDMPLAARTNTPFPGQLPRGTRFIDPPPPKPLAPTPPPPSPAAATPPPATRPLSPAAGADELKKLSLRSKPQLPETVSAVPGSSEPGDRGDKPGDNRNPSPAAETEKPSGWLGGALRRLRGKE